MSYRNFFAFCALVVATLGFVGCGGSDGPTVIQPTEDYQPSEEELADEANAEQMMEQGDR